MANAAGLIKESIWRDRDFRRLPRLAQATYLQLLSQKDLDCAGLLTLHLTLLVKGCDELTDEQLRADLAILEDRRFVFYDEETLELFVRSYMRTAQVVRSPNVFTSALKSARMVESPTLRMEVAAELRRLNRAAANRLADELDPSSTPPEPFQKGSETLSEGVTLSKPPVLVPVSVTGSLSGGSPLGRTPPPLSCPKHPTGTDQPCWACKTYREALEAWETQEHEAEIEAAQSQIKARESAIRSCNCCDEHGRIEIDNDGTLAYCSHESVVAHG